MHKPIKFYISHSMSKIEEAKQFATVLRALGYVVTSTWLNANGGDPLSNESLCLEYSNADIKDMDEANAIIYFSDNNSYGKNIEFGYSLGTGLPIILIGSVRSVFHYKANMRFESKEKFLEWLTAANALGLGAFLA